MYDRSIKYMEIGIGFRVKKGENFMLWRVG